MSLFIQSMIWNGWQLAEETKEFLLFTKSDEGSSISLRLFEPYGGEIRAVLSHGRFGEHACSFNSLSDMARGVNDPHWLRQWLVGQAFLNGL
jgi:hypothetical protein